MEKTQAPTPRRLRRALLEGDSPLSIPLARAGALIAGAFLLPSAAGALRARFDELLRTAVWKPETVAPLRLAEDVALIAGPIVAVAAVAALAVGLVQTRGVVTFGRVLPTLRRLSPVANLAHLWGGLRAYDAMRGVMVTLVLLLVAARALVTAAPDVARAVSGDAGGLRLTGGLVIHLVWLSVMALLALATLDVAVKRAAWIHRWRMSPRDVIEEKRESEGDPDVRRARRRVHEELVRGPPRKLDGA